MRQSSVSARPAAIESQKSTRLLNAAFIGSMPAEALAAPDLNHLIRHHSIDPECLFQHTGAAAIDFFGHDFRYTVFVEVEELHPSDLARWLRHHRRAVAT